MVVLPIADVDTVEALEQEAALTATNQPQNAYAAKLRYGCDDVRFEETEILTQDIYHRRLAWALAHSARGFPDYIRARRLIQEMLNATSEQQAVQELLYLKAVAKLNSEDLIGAHQTVSQLLNMSPHSHQALALKEKINNETLKKGLVGIGIIAGVAAIGGLVAMRMGRR